MASSEDTPLMRQWREVKSRHPDALIFFRVGDFYELFFGESVGTVEKCMIEPTNDLLNLAQGKDVFYTFFVALKKSGELFVT